MAKVKERLGTLNQDGDLDGKRMIEYIVQMTTILTEAEAKGYENIRVEEEKEYNYDGPDYYVYVIYGDRDETSEELKRRAAREAKELEREEKRKSKEAQKRREQQKKAKAKAAVQKAKLAKQVIERIKANNPDNKVLHLVLDGEGLDQFMDLEGDPPDHY